MAIVEDEVRNESEEENDIEVVVEDDETEEQEYVDDDSDDDISDDEEALEAKVGELERRITEEPYCYDHYVELIDTLWGLSDLNRWRSAFTRLRNLGAMAAAQWEARLRTETTLAHDQRHRDLLVKLFHEATLDCYSLSVLMEWCTWALTLTDREDGRAQLDEVLKRAGADPLSGKLFWDTKANYERALLEDMGESDPGYKEQLRRLMLCVEELVSRPLLRADESWPYFEELATSVENQDYINRVKKQHDAAQELLRKITQYEDGLLTLEDPEEKCHLYQEYIDKVKELSRDKKYDECDIDGILKVLYDKATHECSLATGAQELCVAYARLARERCSSQTYARVLDTCLRRRPRAACFWVLKMEHLEDKGKEFNDVKTVLEEALTHGLESFKETEALWMCYLEYLRRSTLVDDAASVERLRKNFKLAWDSLLQTWGEEASDCSVPLYRARLEYRLLGDPKQGKELFEEMFKLGVNKTLCKYWEVLIKLESSRSPAPTDHKLRALYRRAVCSVRDYLPAVCALWLDYERDEGTLRTRRDASDLCEEKLKEWRQSYESIKLKQHGTHKQKGKSQHNAKAKFDNKNKGKDDRKGGKQKGKRALDEGSDGRDVKRKKESGVVLEADSKSGTKRSHEEQSVEDTTSKRPRRDSTASQDSSSHSREACTLFVSNLDFKVNEEHLREKLSEFGEIVALRVKAGVKAFGGSICYCQYKTVDAVDEAVKHDRSSLDGRPMFLSKYSVSKSKPTFKYSTQAEKNKLFVKNLPYDSCTRPALEEVFGKYGSLKDIRVVTFKDGKPKGLAYIEYEDERAAATALEKTNGLLMGERKIDVAHSAPPPRVDSGASNLGQPKREITGGMRRTQISSFIPSVLQRASTSAGSSTSNGDTSKALSNSDFRNMLLKNTH